MNVEIKGSTVMTIRTNFKEKEKQKVTRKEVGENSAIRPPKVEGPETDKASSEMEDLTI